MDVKLAQVFAVFLNYLGIVFSKLDVRLLAHHTALEGSTYLTLQGISLQDCWKNCESRVLCSSVNYMRLTHLCQLNYGYHGSDSIVKATVQRKGTVFYYKGSNVLSHHVKCGSTTCTIWNTVCDEATATCPVKECFPLAESTGRSISGNMVAVGDKIMQQCNTGFVPAQGNNATVSSLCKREGHWDNALLCKKQLECCNPACTWRPSATTLNGYQMLEHGVWRDMPCPLGTVFVPLTCTCNWGK